MTKRDPRRLFSPAERQQISARQGHLCGACGRDLPDPFHVHHKVAWAEGGPTHPDNGVALCPECHRTAPIDPPAQFTPRAWQREAHPEILPILRGGQFATLSAAPGAGKTEFTAWIYNSLRATGDSLRIVVFGPNSHLRYQWCDVCKMRGVYLRPDSVTERRGEDGVVITYQSLLDKDRVQQLIDDAAETPTLFVLDEVHHLAKVEGGEAGSWAVNISHVVGTVDKPLHPVLNLSGTLFRSNRSERVTTIRYEQVGDKIETVADYSVTAGRLIAERQLRHIKVLGYDADMNVSPVDLKDTVKGGADVLRAVDLDADTKLRSRLLPEMVRDPKFIEGIVTETVTRLGHASVALEGAPVKGLIIADDIRHAEDIHRVLADQVGSRRAFIAHGKMGDAAEGEIKRFRDSNEQAVMVAIQKITEGYDVPDVCVLTYLRTWRAPLFINQMIGRAMRITQRERDLDCDLPATAIVPNDADVKAAFADVLVGAMNVLSAPPEPCTRCGREICACPPRPRRKVCPFCKQPWKICTCRCDRCGLTRMTGCECWRKPSPYCPVCGKQERYCYCPTEPPRVDLAGSVELAYANVDGDDIDLHLMEGLRDRIRSTGLPTVFVEQVASGLQRSMDEEPMTFLTHLRRGQAQ